MFLFCILTIMINININFFQIIIFLNLFMIILWNHCVLFRIFSTWKLWRGKFILEHGSTSLTYWQFWKAFPRCAQPMNATTLWQVAKGYIRKEAEQATWNKSVSRSPQWLWLQHLLSGFWTVCVLFLISHSDWLLPECKMK